MTSSPLLIRNARVVTLSRGTMPRRGAAMADLAVLTAQDVLIENGLISKLGTGLAAPNNTTLRAIDAHGRALVPGFVDCHTHLCWTGSRLDEWEMKLAGKSYLDILHAGGGIMSTVRAVREATQDELESLLLRRLDAVLHNGTTTIEIKSGYGLTTEDELKMLRAIRSASERWPGTIVPTALLGHAIDPGAHSPVNFVNMVIDETLPAVHDEFPGITIDAYCEHGAWSLADCVRLFDAAFELGHPVRVHADQFSSMGMVREAIRFGALSIDHLEATTHADWNAIGESTAMAVVLPACGFHLDNRYAKPRLLLDPHFSLLKRERTPHVGGALCIATNSNPGSAPCVSMAMVMAIAVRHCGLSPSESLVAATANPAHLLGFSDRGTIAPGKRADLLLLNVNDERTLAYEFGGPGCIEHVICAGQLVA